MSESSALVPADSALKRRQSTQALEDIENKEMDLMRSERKLIREQLASLGREIGMLAQDAEAFKKANQDAMAKMRAAISENSSDIEEEKVARKNGDQKLEDEIAKLRDELDQEKKDRASGDERIMKEMKKELQLVWAALDAKGKDLENLEKEVKRLGDNVKAIPPMIDALKADLQKEVQDRKTAEEPLLDELKNARGQNAKDIKDLRDHLDKDIKAIKDALAKEKVDRDAGDDDLRNEINDIHRDLGPYAKQVPGLHTKLKDLGDVFHPQMKDHKDNLLQHKDDTTDKHNKLGQDIADILKRLEGEGAARKAMLDDIEQMQTAFRTKIRGMLNDEADKAKKERDALADAQKAQDRKTKDLDDDLKKALDTIQALKDALNDCKAQLSSDQADAAEKAKKLDALSKKLDDLRKALEQGLASDKATIDMIIIFLEEHCTGLESLHNDLGHRLLNTQGSKRRVKTYISTSPSKDDEAPSSPGPEAPKPRELTLTPPVDKSKEKKTVPKLDEGQKTKLKDILSGGRVALVVDGGDHDHDDDEKEVQDFQLKLASAIDFKKVHHGKDPKAEFKEEKAAMAMLKDVAAIMEIYPSSVIQIEGHTATPPDRMDGWAQQLADNRASKVKTTMGKLGIASSRLITCGMPGYLGDNESDVKFKVVKF